MTNAEYWQRFLELETGTMPPTDVRKYALTGAFLESAARERGSSLLPYDMPERELPVSDISERLLILIGMTNLAISQCPSAQQEVPS